VRRERSRLARAWRCQAASIRSADADLSQEVDRGALVCQAQPRKRSYSDRSERLVTRSRLTLESRSDRVTRSTVSTRPREV
jgi:hypothetical protein